MILKRLPNVDHILPGLVLLVLLTSSNETNGAKITSLLVPKWVQNGTEEQIVLDCSYTLDKLEEKNFALKWYFGNQSELIYHWIPDLDFRFVNERIHRKFNWDYYINSTKPKFNKFRAIAIKKPTTEQSGLYICEVASEKGTDTRSSSMIVYAPPHEISFSKEYLEDERKILLSYKVQKVYPMPTVVIYQTCGNSKVSKKTTLLHDTTTNEPDSSGTTGPSGGNSHNEDVYSLQHVQYVDVDDVIANHELNQCKDNTIGYFVNFEFMITINGTDFVVKKSQQFILPKDIGIQSPIMSRLVALSSSPSLWPKCSMLLLRFLCQILF